MVKKLYRLTKDREFQIIFRRGRYQQAASFSLHYLPNRLGFSRVGIVVGKKVSKKAVDRNLIKRRLREISGELQQKMKRPFDVVIVVKNKALTTSFNDLKKELEQVFHRAELIK